MVWTVPRMAFMVMTARMTTILSTSPSTAEITAATMRMITRKSANCSRKIRNPDFLPPSCARWGRISPGALGLLGGEPLGATLEAVQQVLAGPPPDLVGFVHSVFSSFPRSGAGTQKTRPFVSPHPAWNPKVSPFQTAAGQACPCIDAAAPQLLVAPTPFYWAIIAYFLPGCQEAYTVFAGAFRLDEGRAAFYNKKYLYQREREER